LCAPRARGVLDQHLAHGARGGGEEVRAVLPVDLARVDQLEVGLVDQRGRLQRGRGAARAASAPPAILRSSA
jgi:hypothetical protein